MNRQIYLACGLTHVPRHLFREYSTYIHSMASQISIKLNLTVRYAFINSDPQLSERAIEDRPRLCYVWDRRMVEESLVLIADVSFPSIGVGIELQLAESRDIPIVLLHGDYSVNISKPVQYTNPDTSRHYLQIGDGTISFMALGLPSVVEVVHYKSDDYPFRRIVDILTKIV